MKKILIIENQPSFRNGLTNLLQALIHQTEVSISSVQEIVEYPSLEKYDLVLLNVQQFLKEHSLSILEYWTSNSAKIALFTSKLEGINLTDVLALNIEGMLVKDLDTLRFLEGIKQILKGDKFIDPSLSTALINEMVIKRGELMNGVNKYHESTPSMESLLTRPQSNIFRLYLKGNTQVDIAERLFITKQSVSNSLAEIQKKLEVDSRQEAIIKAVHWGWDN